MTHKGVKDLTGLLATHFYLSTSLESLSAELPEKVTYTLRRLKGRNVADYPMQKDWNAGYRSNQVC